MSETAQQDERPPVWVGHVSMGTPALAESEAFMLRIGMRPVFRSPKFVILELRGGTHLVLSQEDAPAQETGAETGEAPFDLMVDDVDATHAAFAAQGLAPSAIERGRIHDSFTLTEPGGRRITFNSTHATGKPV